MQEEVEHERPVGVGEVMVDVEKETVEGIFKDGPDDVADEEADQGRSQRGSCRDGKGAERWRHLHEILRGD